MLKLKEKIYRMGNFLTRLSPVIHRCVFLGSMAFLGLDSHAFPHSDSMVVERVPLSFGVRYDQGGVFPTNDFVKGGHFDVNHQEWSFSKENEVHYFSDCIAQFNWGVRPDRWQARAYRNPYYGVGVAFPRFHEERLGKPFSFFATYGARICRITNWLKLNYEINFGYSTNWNHYDRFENPDNVAVGWKHNAHVSLFPYLKISLPGSLDVKAGPSVTHFSNGATFMPNRGMNNYALSLSLMYNVHDSENRVFRDTSLCPPDVPFHIEHDFILTRSFRQIYYDGTNTNLNTQYVQYRHPVFALSYAPMLRWSYKYRVGLSLDFLYDESIGAHADYIMNEYDERMYEHVTLGDMRERMNLGLSVKNELMMYGFSFFLNIGCDFIQGDDDMTHLYEVLGVKIQPRGPVFASVGVRAVYFTKAQFICWSLGYTLSGKPIRRSE